MMKHEEQQPSFFDLDPQTLSSWLKERREPTYRANQLMQWVYEHGATTYRQMSNLPKALRDQLENHLPLYTSGIASQQHSSDGTIKMLLRWPDAATSECVMIPDDHRHTACISTQVGCPVGCVFCASGLDGLQRQLTIGQIVEQAMRVRQVCLEQGGQRLSNVVFMGLGEPLANYQATVAALRIINAPWGMGIAARKITVSTVGLPTQMRRLADEGLQITLALSLHAPTDDLRQEIIPWAQRVGIQELIDAARYYFDRTGREITLEYILLAGVNDAASHARALVNICQRTRANVNLIAYNPVDSLPYGRPKAESVHRFLDILHNQGINAHVRRSRGLDIDAACGQLRRRERSTPIESTTPAVD